MPTFFTVYEFVRTFAAKTTSPFVDSILFLDNASTFLVTAAYVAIRTCGSVTRESVFWTEEFLTSRTHVLVWIPGQDEHRVVNTSTTLREDLFPFDSGTLGFMLDLFGCTFGHD